MGRGRPEPGVARRRRPGAAAAPARRRRAADVVQTRSPPRRRMGACPNRARGAGVAARAGAVRRRRRRAGRRAEGDAVDGDGRRAADAPGPRRAEGSRSADPWRRGAAPYRAGDFKAAEAAFARVGSADGAYDHGNALVVLGKCDAAVASYDRALALRPGRTEATDSRAVAAVRRDRLKTVGGNATGGEVKADAGVFEKGKAKAEAGVVEVAGGKPLSAEEIRGLWLKRVQTKPADFLRAKFAYDGRQAVRSDAGPVPRRAGRRRRPGGPHQCVAGRRRVGRAARRARRRAAGPGSGRRSAARRSAARRS